MLIKQELLRTAEKCHKFQSFKNLAFQLKNGGKSKKELK